MKIVVVQRAIAWEDPKSNFQAIEKMLESQPPEPGSLMVFAEMYATGFSFDLAKVGESEDGPSSQFLRHLAMRWGIGTIGSFPHLPKGESKGLNRLLAYRPDGTLALHYDKIHPFSYGKESQFYQGGQALRLFAFEGWTICPTVCYDLRFPELYRRATLEAGADLLVVIANWPAARRKHWMALLRARAIENQAVVVGLNRVGQDPLNTYSGDSLVIDAKGQTLLDLKDNESLGVVTLDRQDLVEWRQKFPALADATQTFDVKQKC